MRKYRLPILNLLPAFEAAARHKSMQKAALELNISRPAVSHQMVKLEHYVGRPLFQRLPNTLVLTEGGEILLSAVSVAFSHVQRAVTELSAVRSPQRLVLSVDPDFAGLWLIPRLAEFYATVSDTVVEIVAERDALAPLQSEVHCAIRYAAVDAEPEHGEILFRSILFPVYSATLAKDLPLRSLRDLGRHVLLHDRSMSEWEEYLDGSDQSAGVDAGKGIVFSRSALCLEAAARGHGVAIGDNFLAATYLAEGRLIRPFKSSLMSRNAYYFVVLAGASAHPAVDAFRSWLLSTVERQRVEGMAG